MEVRAPRWTSCARHSNRPVFSFKNWRCWVSPLVCTWWWPQSSARHLCRFSWIFSFSQLSFYVQMTSQPLCWASSWWWNRRGTKQRAHEQRAHHQNILCLTNISEKWWGNLKVPSCKFYITSSWCNDTAHRSSSMVLPPSWNRSHCHVEELKKSLIQWKSLRKWSFRIEPHQTWYLSKSLVIAVLYA